MKNSIAGRSHLSLLVSAAGKHRQAAIAHDLAARQHRLAADYHSKRMLHQAGLAAASAVECAQSANSESKRACGEPEASRAMQFPEAGE